MRRAVDERLNNAPGAAPRTRNSSMFSFASGLSDGDEKLAVETGIAADSRTIEREYVEAGDLPHR